MIAIVATTAMAVRGTGVQSFSHAGAIGNTALVFIRHPGGSNVSSVTYGGLSMSSLTTQVDNNGDNHSIWGLRNMYPGTQTIVITPGDGNATYAGAITLSGVDTAATFPDVFNSNLAITPPDNITVSVTTDVDHCVLIGYGGHRGTNTIAISAGTGTTAVSITDFSGLSDGIFEGNPFDSGTAGSKSLNVKTAGKSGQDIFLIVIALIPSAYVPVSSNVMIV